jgi:hypothetical protein
MAETQEAVGGAINTWLPLTFAPPTAAMPCGFN